MQTTASKRTQKKKRAARKTVVEKVAGFSIRQDRNGYIVQVRRKDLNETTYHQTLDGAKLYCQSLAEKRIAEGVSGFALTPVEREDARKALDALKGRATLREAVAAWLRLNPEQGALTVADLIERHLADLTARKRRPATIRDRRQRLEHFKTDFGKRAVSAITRDDVSAFLKARATGSFNNHRLNLSALFSYALKTGAVESNPVAAVPGVTVERGEPHFWTPQTVAALLNAAAEYAPATVPAFALSAFAGLRPKEALELDWSNLNLDERSIRVPAAVAKKRRARQFAMPENLAVWLRSYARDSGPVAPSLSTMRRWGRRVATVTVLGVAEVKRRKDAARGRARKSDEAKAATWKAIERAAKEKAKGKFWPQDVLRHSFATHWMAKEAHEGRLAEIMGNSPAVIQRHYKGLTKAASGRDYFEIMPPSPIRLVEHEQATA